MSVKQEARTLEDDVREEPEEVPNHIWENGPRRPGHLPCKLLLIMQLLGQFAMMDEKVYVVDAFSGKGGISWAFQRKSKRGSRLDIKLDPRDDICTDLGFLRHLWCVMHLERGGLLSMGIVCSSWSVMSRYTTGRCPAMPMGNTNYPAVVAANLMVSRALLLIYAALFMGAHFMVENPLQSLITKHTRFAQLITYRPIYQIVTFLGMFGHGCAKPTRLISNDPWVYQLQRKLDRRKVNKTMVLAMKGKSKKGKTTFTGNKANLKKAQAYTGRFAGAVARSFLLHAERHPEHNMMIDFTPDDWSDARLGAVQDLLVKMIADKMDTRRLLGPP